MSGKGLFCPFCGQRMELIEVTELPKSNGKSIMRRWRCVNCDNVFDEVDAYGSIAPDVPAERHEWSLGYVEEKI